MSKNNSDTKNTKCLMICDRCGKSFKFKSKLIKHILMHTAQDYVVPINKYSCEECDKVFKNKGLLICHNVKIHNRTGPVTKRSPLQVKAFANKNRKTCEACKVHFVLQSELTYHIRESHFNLQSQAPYSDFKKVNQVWFEKVLNSASIVEIKKMEENVLLMRKLNDNTAMKVSDHPTEVIDLHSMYPTVNSNMTRCDYCNRFYNKTNIRKHIFGVHLRQS